MTTDRMYLMDVADNNQLNFQPNFELFEKKSCGGKLFFLNNRPSDLKSKSLIILYYESNYFMSIIKSNVHHESAMSSGTGFM